MKIRIVDPPSSHYVAHGIVAVPHTVDHKRMRASNGNVEQTRVVLQGPVWKLVEFAAVVRGGTTEVLIVDGEQRDSTSSIRRDLKEFAETPAFDLVIEGHTTTESIRLGRGVPWIDGPLRAGFVGHAHTQSFGSFRWWTTVNLLDERVWMTIRWENSVDELGRARPEFLFRAAKILNAPTRFISTLDDPAILGGGTGSAYLCKPGDHVVPQRDVRDYRIVFYSEAPFAHDGWGTGDWERGGFLPAGLKVPPILTNAVRSRASAERLLFAANKPTGGASATDTVSYPVSVRKPHAGVPYGGMSGEIDIWPYDGCLTASTAQHEGLDMHRILATRYGCRQLLIFEADGSPVIPENHLVNGFAPWSIFDFVFQRDSATGQKRDAPWEFDQAPISGYDPTKIMPIDWQHGIRALKDAIALIWLDGDPAAIEYVIAMAENARMTFWPGQGQARRLIPPVTPGIGWDVGRAEAWAGHAIVVASMLGRPYMQEWCLVLRDGFARATMPSGLSSALRYGKVVVEAPLNSRFVAHRGNELSYFAELIEEFRVGLNFDVTSIQSNLAMGTRNLAWAIGSGGCWDRHPLGLLAGGPMYQSRVDVPSDAWEQPTWSYYSGNLVGSLNLIDLYREWLGQNVLLGKTEFRGAPIEVWLPALSRWAI